MSNRRIIFGILLAALLGTTEVTSAQSLAGVRLGYDTEFNALVLGGEVRFPVNRIEDFPLVGNPSFEYYLLDQYAGLNETLAEINANAYYEFELEDREDLIPYAGAGLGLRYYSIEETTTDVGADDLDLIVNIVGGGTYDVSSRITPFGHLRLSLGGGTSTVGLIAGILFSL